MFDSVKSQNEKKKSWSKCCKTSVVLGHVRSTSPRAQQPFLSSELSKEVFSVDTPNKKSQCLVFPFLQRPRDMIYEGEPYITTLSTSQAGEGEKKNRFAFGTLVCVWRLAQSWTAALGSPLFEGRRESSSRAFWEGEKRKEIPVAHSAVFSRNLNILRLLNDKMYIWGWIKIGTNNVFWHNSAAPWRRQ